MKCSFPGEEAAEAMAVGTAQARGWSGLLHETPQPPT